MTTESAVDRAHVVHVTSEADGSHHVCTLCGSAGPTAPVLPCPGEPSTNAARIHLLALAASHLRTRPDADDLDDATVALLEDVSSSLVVIEHNRTLGKFDGDSLLFQYARDHTVAIAQAVLREDW